MTRTRLVNLLDDFALGGVARGLAVFASAPVREVADCSTVAIPADAVFAPRLDADVIVIHFPPNWHRLAFLVSLRLRNPQARIVHVEHSYTRAWEALKVRHRARFRLMLRIALRLVDHVVCVSEGQAAWLREVSGLADERIEVIHPYCENPGLDRLAIPDFCTSRPLVVGAYGRFAEAKGFDHLIAAFKAGAMPGAQLLIGGFGELVDKLQTLAGDTPGIQFAGKIDDVAGFLARCDVIAVPSRWEAYGQVANEAREAGRPILVAEVDGLPEQVGQAGLVVDFRDLAAVEAVFRDFDPARYGAMARAARDATAFCGPQRYRRWAQLIRRLVPREPVRLADWARA